MASGGRFASINRPIAGPTHDKILPIGNHPLQLYSLGTPNGVKITILLEELLAQGINDFVVFSSQSIGALSAGILLFSTSWKTLNLICLPLLILLLLFSLLNMKKLKDG